MNTPLIVQYAALSAPAIITIALVQSRALLGRLRPAAGMRAARTGVLAAPTR